MAGKFEPLDRNFAIVDAQGNPTDYFIRWAQEKQLEIGDSITLGDLIDYLAAHPLQAGSGIQLTPSGNLADSPTISADVQAILDQITNVQGSVLFRGAAGWDELLPGTLGHFLRTKGASANPEWAASGVAVEDDNVEIVASASRLNFTGAGVTVTDSGGGEAQIAIPGGGGGGGGGQVMLPFPHDQGIIFTANSGLLGVPFLFVVSAFAHSATAIAGLHLPIGVGSAGRHAIPVIYEGPSLTSSAVSPNPDGAALVASGAKVEIPSSSTVYFCPFSTSFTPTVGKMYWIGFAIVGAAVNIRLNLLANNRRYWIVTGGAYDPPPDPLPAMGNGSVNWACIWAS